MEKFIHIYYTIEAFRNRHVLKALRLYGMLMKKGGIDAVKYEKD